MGLCRFDCYLVGWSLIGGDLGLRFGYHVRGDWIGFRGRYG